MKENSTDKHEREYEEKRMSITIVENTGRETEVPFCFIYRRGCKEDVVYWFCFKRRILTFGYICFFIWFFFNKVIKCMNFLTEFCYKILQIYYY